MESSNKKEALRIFLNSDKKEISNAISFACEDPVGNLRRIEERLKNYREEEDENHSPMKIAEHWHDMMILGCISSENEKYHEYEAFFTIVHAAEDVAGQALENAYDSPGRLKELSDLMRGIEKREGLRNDEFWQVGSGPDDYQKHEEESGDLSDKIHCAVLGYVLRMYGFKSYAELLDVNRMEFDIRREAGRRMILGCDINAEKNQTVQHAEKCLERKLVDKYGNKAVQELYSHIEEIKIHRKGQG